MQHEALLRLFANRISLAPEVLRDMLGFALPAHTAIRREAADLSELVPVEFRADLVLLLEVDRPVLAIVVEVQLGRDARKRRVWPTYLTAPGARFDCGEVAIEATRSLDDERARLYADLIVSAMGPAAKRALEELLMSNKYEYQSDFARKYYGQGRAEGEAAGKAEALLVLLSARGLAVTAPARARILAERTPAQLDAWIRRAATAPSLREVLGDPAS